MVRGQNRHSGWPILRFLSGSLREEKYKSGFAQPGLPSRRLRAECPARRANALVQPEGCVPQLGYSVARPHRRPRLLHTGHPPKMSRSSARGSTSRIVGKPPIGARSQRRSVYEEDCDRQIKEGHAKDRPDGVRGGSDGKRDLSTALLTGRQFFQLLTDRTRRLEMHDVGLDAGPRQSLPIGERDR